MSGFAFGAGDDAFGESGKDAAANDLVQDPRQGVRVLPRVVGIHLLLSWCTRRELNPHALRHKNLNLTCLPIPPRVHAGQERRGV